MRRWKIVLFMSLQFLTFKRLYITIEKNGDASLLVEESIDYFQLFSDYSL